MSDVSVEICLMQPLGSTSGKKLQIGSFKSKPGPVFFGFLRTGSHYVAQAGLELRILLLQPPRCWGHKCVPPCVAEQGVAFLFTNSAGLAQRFG
jgi:hypothetical protein